MNKPVKSTLGKKPAITSREIEVTVTITYMMNAAMGEYCGSSPCRKNNDHHHESGDFLHQLQEVFNYNAFKSLISTQRAAHSNTLGGDLLSFYFL